MKAKIATPPEVTLPDAPIKPTKQKPGGRLFVKGKSGNPKGRPKGIVQKDKTEQSIAIRTFGEGLFLDQGTPLRALKGKNDKYTFEEILATKPYLEGVVLRIKLGTATHLERFVWEHLFGKPKQILELKTPPRPPMAAAVAAMTQDELTMFANLARRMIASQSEPTLSS
jgi:hypothetical protein